MKIKDLKISLFQIEVYIAYLDNLKQQLERTLGTISDKINVKDMVNLFNAKESLKSIIKEFKELHVIRSEN